MRYVCYPIQTIVPYTCNNFQEFNKDNSHEEIQSNCTGLPILAKYVM